MKYLLVVLFMALVAVPVLAQPPGHIGDLCATCHDKFSAEKPYALNLSLPVENIKITRIFPCYKGECHRVTSVRRGGEHRHEIHMNKKICGNCHSAKDGRSDIHSIHLKQGEKGGNRTPIECKTCHRSPRGYNSSIAYVPPYDSPSIAGSTLVNTSIRIPPWGNDCGYCHPSVADAKRLHDVHEPIIKRICPECHGEVIKSRPGLVARITHETIPKKNSGGENSVIVQVFSDLFGEMARYILKIMS